LHKVPDRVPKVVFLDIDGVLCTWRSHFAQGGPVSSHGTMWALDREAVGLLNVMAANIGDVQFVIMSTWRLHFSKDEIIAHLRANRFAGNLHNDWCTPAVHHRLSEGADIPKGRDVRAWLEAHPDVTTYVIIDDQAMVHPIDEAHHVRPRYDDGLSWENFRSVMSILGSPIGLPHV
jgi:HAD domain in Swiss Army Knife RNA repair proteins